MFGLCAPALIYVAFSLTQVIIDSFKGLYNTALLKIIVMIIITILLNTLCQSGMGIVSWIIVFIPFIFMSVIVAILLYVFGLDPATGKINVIHPKKGGNLVFSSSNHMDVSYSDTPMDPIVSNSDETMWSSDPQYQ